MPIFDEETRRQFLRHSFADVFVDQIHDEQTVGAQVLRDEAGMGNVCNASDHQYKKMCPSVGRAGPSVRWSIGK